MKINHNNYFNLAFNLAKLNLGKTKSNPSVGCVVVKDGSVISSGYTSIGGRPHAEVNALNKNMNFRGSDLYVTMEPCTHHGLTPPCTNIIKKKKINNVYFSFYDIDKRTARKSKSTLIKNKIKVYKKENNFNKDFYLSYVVNKVKELPLLDAKIAFSKDYFTISKKKGWITNNFSRARTHLIRSEYDSVISTSKSINKDNSLLNCRLEGFDPNKPNLIIIDLKFVIKTNLDLFNLPRKRKIFIVTSNTNNKKKMLVLKKKLIKFINIKALKSKNDFIQLLKILKKNGSCRILVESGLIFLNKLLKEKLITNLYIFKSSTKLGKNGFNNCSTNLIKKLKILKKVNVNLNGDQLNKIKIR